MKNTSRTQGKSFKALFSGSLLPDRILYFDNIINSPKSNHDALLTDNYKLIVENKENKNYFLLYGLSDDPDESADLSIEKPQIIEELFQIISGFRRENDTRKKRNLRLLEKNIDLESIMKQKLKILKTLGYVE